MTLFGTATAGPSLTHHPPTGQEHGRPLAREECADFAAEVRRFAPRRPAAASAPTRLCGGDRAAASERVPHPLEPAPAERDHVEADLEAARVLVPREPGL